MQKHNISKGFTTVELIIAAALSVTVVGVAGVGTITVMENNKSASAQVEARMELNRTSDFISTEIRQAETIEEDALTADLATLAPDFTLPTGAVPVLVLNIPNVEQRIIYYVAPKPAGSTWDGPNLIYRWGPNFSSSGDYADASTPATWNHELLADGIDDTALPGGWSCPSGSLSPSTGATGFYACVDGGKVAQIYLNGVVDLPNEGGDLYQADTDTFARAEDAPALPAAPAALISNPVGAGTATPSPTPTPSAPGVCPVNLGSAKGYTVFAMTTKFSMSSPQTLIGGDAAIGPEVVQSFSDGTISGTFYVDPTADNSKSNNVNFNGGTVNQDLTQAVADVQSAVAQASSLTATQTFGDIQDPTTISSEGSVNVIDVNKIVFTSSDDVLTIDGSADDLFVINVASDVKLSGTSRIELSGGLTPSNVLFNVVGELVQSGDTSVKGTFLVPNKKIRNDSAEFAGAMFAPEISFTGGAGVNVESFIFGADICS